MKRISLLLISMLVLAVMLSSCRPPELEGAFVDYNAGRLDNAMKLALEATQKYPDNAEAWYLLGDLYGKKDNYAGMVKAYDKSLSLSQQFAKKIELNKKYYFQTAFNSGVTNYNAFTKIEDRESEQAKATLKKAISYFNSANLIKQDYRAVSLAGLSFTLMGERDSALAYYTKLTKINPDTADGWISVGNIHFIDGHYKKAAKYLKKALEIEPENVEALTLISQSYDLSGDREHAISAYQAAMVANKEEKAFPFNLGLLYIKMAGEDSIEETTKKDYLQKSITNFATVIALDKEMKEPYELKSTAEIQLGKFDDALATLNMAVEHFPNEGSLWFNLGVVHSRLGNKTEAEKAFARAEELGYQ